jgi:acetaldehyde dehydrogenase/alcohol dehydrogenase
MSAFLRCSPVGGEAGARALAQAVRDLCREIEVPTSLSGAGVEEGTFQSCLDKLVEDAFNDTQMVTAVRSPSYEELRELYRAAYEGRPVDF